METVNILVVLYFCLLQNDTVVAMSVPLQSLVSQVYFLWKCVHWVHVLFSVMGISLSCSYQKIQGSQMTPGTNSHILYQMYARRRNPIFAFDEVPTDTSENCRAFCRALYNKLLRHSNHFRSCIGICACEFSCASSSVSMLLFLSLLQQLMNVWLQSLIVCHMQLALTLEMN